MTKTKSIWSYKILTIALADTGDYENTIEFTNGKKFYYTNKELDEYQCNDFCELLNAMPDLWSSLTNESDYKIAELKSQVIELEKERDDLENSLYNLVIQHGPIQNYSAKTSVVQPDEAYRNACKLLQSLNPPQK